MKSWEQRFITKEHIVTYILGWMCELYMHAHFCKSSYLCTYVCMCTLNYNCACNSNIVLWVFIIPIFPTSKNIGATNFSKQVIMLISKHMQILVTRLYYRLG